MKDRCGTVAGYQVHKRRGEAPCAECTSAQKEYQAAYYSANKESIVAYRYANSARISEWQADYRASTKGSEDKAKYGKAYYEENRVRLLEQHKQYYALNRVTILEGVARRSASRTQSQRDQDREQKKEYRAVNKERISERMSIYSRSHPEVFRRSGNKRKALKLGNGHEPYTEAEILELWGTDCHICGEPIDLEAPRRAGLPGWEQGLHMDHVTALINGGPDTKENVKPAHGICNLRKYTASMVQDSSTIEEE